MHTRSTVGFRYFPDKVAKVTPTSFRTFRVKSGADLWV